MSESSIAHMARVAFSSCNRGYWKVLEHGRILRIYLEQVTNVFGKDVQDVCNMDFNHDTELGIKGC